VHGSRRPGQILGHEFAGTLVELGSAVTGWHVGQPVAVDPHGFCGQCEWCLREVNLRCPNRPHLGLTEPGGYADFVAVPAAQLSALRPEVALESGAHVEPLAVAVRALREANLHGGEDVLVFGAGPIGLRVILAARAMGAGRVVALEISPARAAAARAVGAHAVLDSRQLDLSTFAADHGWSFGTVLECAGVPAALSACVEAASGGGTIVQVAMGRIESPLLTERFVRKHLTLVSSTAFSPRDFGRALDLISDRSVDLRPLVSERIGLADAPEAFVRLRRPDSAVGILVQPSR
jgi:(R,R)-butanediol dehydrogenase/meso-butanediol dehydrogenase/diacetyl reductase